MHEMDPGGSPAATRFTEYMRYLLPPLVPREEVTIQTDRWQRYQLPSPTTGRKTAYTRATTLAKGLSDSSGLENWRIREKVAAVLRASEFAALVASNKADSLTDNQIAMGAAFADLERQYRTGKSTDVNNAINLIDDLNGGADARELGTAVHDWLGELDMGRVLYRDLPDYIKPYADSYHRVLAEAGLVAVPEYTERVVLNDRGKESIAGRLDRIYRVVDTGELILGDLKTSKTSSFDSAKDDWAVQLAVYGYATLMLNLDGLTWGPMPDINQDYCVVVHLPSDQPDRASVVPFDLAIGGEGMLMAMEIRAMRKEIKQKALAAAHPEPSAGSRALVSARHALLNIEAREDASRVFEQYEDIWTDELTELGTTCIELLAETDEEN